MIDEKIYNQNFNNNVYGIYIFLLYLNMVYPFVVGIMIKKFLIMILCMGFTGGAVILLDYYISLPDEVSGVLYFLSIGIAAWGVLNYYK